MMTRIFVEGHPIPQPRARVTVRAGHGHAYVPAKHPVHEWRRNVRQSVTTTHVYAEPVHVSIKLRIPRPMSHLKRNGQVKPAYAKAVPPGDVDNYAKAICDALTDAGCWYDDKQIVGLSITKQWDRNPGAEIMIWDFDAEPTY